MIDWLVNLDTQLFLYLNNVLANPVFDRVMPIITNDWVLRVVFLIIVVLLAIFGKRQGRVVALLCIVTVALSDQVSSHLIKPLITRVRPCHVVSDVHLLVACSQGLSFPSSHAANSFAIATLISLSFRRRIWLYLTIAGVVSYSRIAVGVHYPFDVLAGALVGVLCATVVFAVYQYTSAWLDKRKARLSAP
jgi:membrane-associated phospholipid phosphatase